MSDHQYYPTLDDEFEEDIRNIRGIRALTARERPFNCDPSVIKSLLCMLRLCLVRPVWPHQPGRISTVIVTHASSHDCYCISFRTFNIRYMKSFEINIYLHRTPTTKIAQWIYHSRNHSS